MALSLLPFPSRPPCLHPLAPWEPLLPSYLFGGIHQRMQLYAYAKERQAPGYSQGTVWGSGAWQLGGGTAL